MFGRRGVTVLVDPEAFVGGIILVIDVEQRSWVLHVVPNSKTFKCIRQQYMALQGIVREGMP